MQDVQMFIEFANFYWRFIKSFSKIAAPLNSILKISPKLADALSATGIDDSKFVGSRAGNNGKSTKSDFTKFMGRVEKFSFLTSDVRQTFTQLK